VQVGFVGQTVGVGSDAVGLRLGAGCLANEGLMFVNGVDEFPCSGTEFGLGLLAGSGPWGVQERVDEP